MPEALKDLPEADVATHLAGAPAEVTQAAARTQAEQILDEIESAAQAAEHNLAQSAVADGTAAAPLAVTAGSESAADGHTEQAAQTPEEIERAKQAVREARLAFFMKRAQDQKRRGRQQLERVVSGAMGVRRDIEFFDVNVASSAERFLGLIDLALYTVNRRGEDVLGERGAADVIEKLMELTSGYRDKGAAERDQAAALLANEKELAFDTDWITPEYRSNAFHMEVFIKHLQTLSVIDGLRAFDDLIRDLTILQWNGKVDQVRIDQARQQERRALSALHQFAGRSLIGLNRRARTTSRAPAAKPAEPAVSAESVAVAA